MSDVNITEQGTSTVTCDGCGKSFRGPRGLASHQNHRNAAASCKPAQAVAEGTETTEVVVEPVAAPVAGSDRDELISTARFFTSVPEQHTVLVKIDGRDKWANRMLADDAYKIARTADSSTVVKVTKHEAGGETVVTDYYWNDGLRARMTEKCAV